MERSPERPTQSSPSGRWSRFAGSASSTAGVSHAIAPQNVLHENEIVILMLRPSVWYILATSSTYIVVVLALALLATTSRLIDQWIGFGTMGTIVGILIGCRLLYGVMEWIGHHYILTNCRLITIQGLLQPQISQTVLGRISGITISQSLPQKVLHTGTLGFTFDAAQKATGTWHWIRSPQRVEQQIRQAISKYRGKMGS